MAVRRRYTEISGFQGVLAGLLVALKQIIPETEVTLLQVFKLRAKVRRAPAPAEGEHAGFAGVGRGPGEPPCCGAAMLRLGVGPV